MDSQVRKDYIWNTIGSGIYALSSMLLAFAAMHLAGPDDGGIFGFGFSAFGQQMFIIAYFGIRPFHITDAAYQYSYEDYRRLRVRTALAAAAAALAYLALMILAGRYGLRKSAVIFLLALYKIADGVGDLYESECQRAGVLWLGGMELSARTAAAGGALIAVLFAARDILKAAAAGVIVQCICLVLFRAYLAAHVLTADTPAGTPVPEGIQSAAGAGNVRGLFRSTVLLFLSVFADFYIFSASKYAIDAFLTDADSGIFNILFMPTSVIYLAANFIIRPYMTRLSALYESGDTDGFDRVSGMLKRLVLALSAAAVAGTVLLGRPVLYVLERLLGEGYAGMLTQKSGLFILIILGGCFYALSNLYYYLLVIMRRQRNIFINYLIIAAAAAVIANAAAAARGISGAAASFPLYMGAATILFALTERRILKAERG